MNNSSEIIKKIADRAVEQYKTNQIDPSLTIINEFKKKSGYNFNHIKRASEKANVGIIQEVIIKKGEDKGRSFNLANANNIAHALLIDVEKTAEANYDLKDLKDLSKDFGKRASASTNFETNNFCTELEPKKVDEVFAKQKEANYIKIANKKVVEAIFEIEDELKNLDQSIKLAMYQHKDLSAMVKEISEKFDQGTASVFVKSAVRCGFEMNYKKIAELKPITFLPKDIKDPLTKIALSRNTIIKVTSALKNKRSSK